MARRKDRRKERKRKRRNEKIRRRKHEGQERPYPREGFASDWEAADWDCFVDDDEEASVAVPTGAPAKPDRFIMERMLLTMADSPAEAGPDGEEDPVELFAKTLQGDAWRQRYADLLRKDPRARARELTWRAQDRPVADAREMARRALEWDPDCPEALAILAYDFTGLDPDDPAADPVIGLAAAVAAGERALGGASYLDENTGSFWQQVITRPYVRVRSTLATELVARGRLDEAAGHYRALWRLSPDRPQDYAGCLAACLLGTGDADGLKALLGEVEAAADDEDPPGFADLWAPWAEVGLHLLTGDREAAVTALFAADGENPCVGRLFTLSSSRRPEYAGDVGNPEDEAALVVDLLGPGFDRVPGMQGFLHRQLALR